MNVEYLVIYGGIIGGFLFLFTVYIQLLLCQIKLIIALMYKLVKLVMQWKIIIMMALK